MPTSTYHSLDRGCHLCLFSSRTGTIPPYEWLVNHCSSTFSLPFSHNPVNSHRMAHTLKAFVSFHRPSAAWPSPYALRSRCLPSVIVAKMTVDRPALPLLKVPRLLDQITRRTINEIEKDAIHYVQPPNEREYQSKTINLMLLYLYLVTSGRLTFYDDHLWSKTLNRPVFTLRDPKTSKLTRKDDLRPDYLLACDNVPFLIIEVKIPNELDTVFGQLERYNMRLKLNEKKGALQVEWYACSDGNKWEFCRRDPITDKLVDNRRPLELIDPQQSVEAVVEWILACLPDGRRPNGLRSNRDRTRLQRLRRNEGCNRQLQGSVRASEIGHVRHVEGSVCTRERHICRRLPCLIALCCMTFFQRNDHLNETQRFEESLSRIIYASRRQTFRPLPPSFSYFNCTQIAHAQKQAGL
mmetsp:Transcript_27625/g.68875  ORF Transcript_27625/g.68875 Transcript_27625/m.68875 type:complete len:410 (-) Transcript_27625:1452-2681(-)